MKKMRFLLRIFALVIASGAIFKDDITKFVACCILLIVCFYIWPSIIIFIIRKLGVSDVFSSKTLYDGEIVITEPKDDEKGQIAIKLYDSPETIAESMDELSLIVIRENS